MLQEQQIIESNSIKEIQMKVVILQGSARKKGNTARVLTWVENELQTLGHEVEGIYLHSKNLKGCMGCGKCKEKPVPTGCIQKDDMPEVMEKVVGSQLTIFSSPLYFWGFSAQIKAVIDRTYSFYTNANQPDHASLVDGQRQALVATGAGGFDENAEGMIDAFGRMQKYHKAVNAGTLFIDSCTTPDAMDDTIRQKAVEFARKIVS
jgi:multimeric flavodoxin WrbA